MSRAACAAPFADRSTEVGQSLALRFLWCTSAASAAISGYPRNAVRSVLRLDQAVMRPIQLGIAEHLCRSARSRAVSRRTRLRGISVLARTQTTVAGGGGGGPPPEGVGWGVGGREG